MSRATPSPTRSSPSIRWVRRRRRSTRGATSRSAGVSGRMRLPQGGLVERDRVVSFTFNGKSYKGLGGDTLAAALLATGVHLVGRSFKYHWPRGVVRAGAEEANERMQAGGATSSETKRTERSRE